MQQKYTYEYIKLRTYFRINNLFQFVCFSITVKTYSSIFQVWNWIQYVQVQLNIFHMFNHFSSTIFLYNSQSLFCRDSKLQTEPVWLFLHIIYSSKNIVVKMLMINTIKHTTLNMSGTYVLDHTYVKDLYWIVQYL